jgi:hypothetical protein
MEHWLRADLAATPGQAKYRCCHELDEAWTRLRCRKVWCKPDVEGNAERIAEGEKEPYDGWPWVSALKDEPGAVCYWHVSVSFR